MRPSASLLNLAHSMFLKLPSGSGASGHLTEALFILTPPITHERQWPR